MARSSKITLAHASFIIQIYGRLFGRSKGESLAFSCEGVSIHWQVRQRKPPDVSGFEDSRCHRPATVGGLCRGYNQSLVTQFSIRYGLGLGSGVGRALGVGMVRGVGVGRGVEVGVAVAVAVGVGVGVGVTVGVGVGPPDGKTRTK